MHSEHVSNSSAASCIHHIERIFGDAANNQRFDRNSRLDDRLKSVLSVTDHAAHVQLHRVPGQPPFAATNRRNECFDTTLIEFAILATPRQPIRSHVGSDKRDAHIQAVRFPRQSL
jgi:hypothetical protein